MSGSGPTRRIDDWKPLDTGEGPGKGSAPTVKNPGGPPGGAPGQDRDNNNPQTMIAGAPTQGQTRDGNASDQTPPSESKNFMDDPVVGWLVITKGPGRGTGLRLGKGMNSIGRSNTNRVQLDFGDQSVSREKHCIVTFEPKRRVFYIQNEGGKNLTYVGDTVVLQAQQLHNGEFIQIGDTEMCFVAFCNEDFSWDDGSE